MREKRVAVMSAGAIGASVAADMALAGWNVTIIDTWPQHIEAVRTNGLTVMFPGGDSLNARVDALHACDIATLRHKFDVVFLGAKAYDTRWVAELIKPLLHGETLVAGLQNSLCDEDIAQIVGRERVIGCVVELAAEVFEPGVVVRHTSHANTWFGIGALDEASLTRMSEVETLLKTGARTSVLADVTAAKWTKLVANAVILGPVGLAGTTIAEAFAMPEMLELAAEVGRESVEVARACGHDIQPVFGLEASALVGTPSEIAQTLVDTIIGHIGPAARSCVLQDHVKGRYSEVDMINGLVARCGRRYAVPTPANDKVVAWTDRIFNGKLAPCRSNIRAMMTADD